MAEIIATIGAIGSQIAGAVTTAATAAGSFAAAHPVLISSALAGGGTIYSGVRANAASQAESKDLKRKGDEELAIAQIEAKRRRKEAELLTSRQRAVAGASGAGVNDPSVTAIMAKTEEEGSYNAMLDMYNGLTSRADLRNQARESRREGRDALWGSFVDAGRSIYSDWSEIKRRRGKDYVY